MRDNHRPAVLAVLVVRALDRNQGPAIRLKALHNEAAISFHAQIYTHAFKEFNDSIDTPSTKYGSPDMAQTETGKAICAASWTASTVHS